MEKLPSVGSDARRDVDKDVLNSPTAPLASGEGNPRKGSEARLLEQGLVFGRGPVAAGRLDDDSRFAVAVEFALYRTGFEGAVEVVGKESLAHKEVFDAKAFFLQLFYPDVFVEEVFLGDAHSARRMPKLESLLLGRGKKGGRPGEGKTDGPHVPFLRSRAKTLSFPMVRIKEASLGPLSWEMRMR